MCEKYERFVRWYLRFNGYFTIDNFIVHAADDPSRISRNHIAPHTETDILGIRMRYSREIAGSLYIANHEPLVSGQHERFDAVIAEVKTGKSNKPNDVWKHGKIDPIEYIIRFIGLYDDESTLTRIASELATNFSYENDQARIRYVIFAEEANEHYKKKKIKYITYSEIIDFLVETRGQSWIYAGIGVASVHQQWDPLINRVFEIANDQQIPIEQRYQAVADLFA